MPFCVVQGELLFSGCVDDVNHLFMAGFLEYYYIQLSDIQIVLI